ncbi:MULTISPECIES: DUF2931 family protein [unclassified Serratia (in: enterobacteria)]|uniref:DUF2931 family protein n=1 Tax=unclassified Serratia (in: enterobacteria) TaxID=2647522 RepID=UPI002ED01277|nr:DUF2931 family protein [Serratia sp. C2(2)]MEE4449588.1 DUF2931 family protein [Serratia sp. C2(1)]
MEIMRLAGLLSVLTLTACQGAGQPNATAAKSDVPTEWKFNFFTPKALPALVTFAVILDVDGTDYRFNTLNSTPDMDKVIGEWNNDSRAPSGYWNKIKSPPRHLFFCWDSIIDKKVYETRLTFAQSDTEKMRQPSVHKDYQGDPTYYDNIQVGLAPEGKVAVWLVGIGAEPNYRVTPSVITTVSGDKLDLCKGVTKSDFSYGYDKDIKDFIKGKKYPYGNWN